jgi:hypothetical protein
LLAAFIARNRSGRHSRAGVNLSVPEVSVNKIVLIPAIGNFNENLRIEVGAGFRAKPDDPSILIIKGAPPRKAW